MALYKLGERKISSDDPGFQEALAIAYRSSQEARCLCWRLELGEKHEGVLMSIADLRYQFAIKRMPNRAEEHHPTCVSFELPADITPYGDLQRGKAVETLRGRTTLKLAYSLSEGGEREPTGGTPQPPPTTEESEPNEGDAKLTIRATLHYLWHQAELHKWDPGFAGTRDWKMISSSLREAAKEKQTGLREPLGDVMFVPVVPEVSGTNTEPRGIAGALAKMASRSKKKNKNQTPLLLLISEYKDITPYVSHAGFTRNDVPEFPFLMEDEHEVPWAPFYKNFRMATDLFSITFKDELDLLRAHRNCHLIAIATISFTDKYLVTTRNKAVMLVNENWLPFQNFNEKRIIDELTAKDRLFDVVLRFNQNLDSVRPFVIVKDAAPKPTALYIVPKRPKDGYKEQVEKQAAIGNYEVWFWNPSIDKEYPPLPLPKE